MNKQRILVLAVVAAAIAALLVWRNMAGAGSETVAVKVPALSATAATGQTLFAKSCAACHGASAGGSDKGPPLVHIYYEPNHHPDQAFQIAARFGVRQHHWRFGNMPPVAGITEQQVTSIISFVRALQRANGIN